MSRILAADSFEVAFTPKKFASTLDATKSFKQLNCSTK
jgi:hypothetical protein